jgi:hypothetical protein
MNRQFRRGTNNIAQNRALRPIRTSPELIIVPLIGDKTNVQTTTSHRTVPANAVRFICQHSVGDFLPAVPARTFAKLRSDKFGRSAAEAGLDAV